jgi:hypothetical protein
MELNDFPEPPMPLSLPMQGPRLDWCLEVVGWTRGELRRRLKLGDNTVKEWLSGKRNIPTPVAIWMETLAAMHMALPAPYFWHENADAGERRHSDHYQRSYRQRAPMPGDVDEE